LSRPVDFQPQAAFFRDKPLQLRLEAGRSPRASSKLPPDLGRLGLNRCLALYKRGACVAW
jgi:hypothetical protein